MTDEQKIQIEKVKQVIKKQFADIITVNGVNSLILSVCLVDTLAGFYCGYVGQKKGNRDRFLKFVEKYLSSYKDHLYDIRCNLTHSYSNTISNFMFLDNPEFSKVFGNNVQIFDSKVFNISEFRVDLDRAIKTYFTDLSNANENLTRNFFLRFNHIGILDDSVIPTVRNLKGEMVVKYADLDNLGDSSLKIAMYDPTNVKK